MSFMLSIPTLAMVTPNVPPRMMMKAGMLMNEAGEVPSIIALNRIATVATTIPMMVAAFMVPIRLIDSRRESSSARERPPTRRLSLRLVARLLGQAQGNRCRQFLAGLGALRGRRRLELGLLELGLAPLAQRSGQDHHSVVAHGGRDLRGVLGNEQLAAVGERDDC